MNTSIGRWGFLAIAVYVVSWATGCGTRPHPEPVSRAAALGTPLERPAATSTQPQFTRLSGAIDFSYRFPDDPQVQARLANAFAGGGVAIGDYDADGWVDVCLTAPSNGPRLYRNLGGFRFQDVSQSVGLSPGLWTSGATFVDIDNDNDLDLYICASDHPNLLYVNQGNGTFREAAAQFGLDYNGASIMMAFADYDCDGDLDAYLLTNNNTPRSEQLALQLNQRNGRWSVEEGLEEIADVMVLPSGELKPIEAAEFDHLYRNNGNGTFTDVSKEAGIEGNYFGLGVVWWDYDDDGLPDLYVANDFYGPDQLLRNNGDGTFTDVTAHSVPHTPWFSMGVDAADLNNDGRADLVASDMAGTTHYRQKLSMGNMGGPDSDTWFLTYPTPRQYMRNAVYLNSGTQRMLEVAHMAGLDSSNWTWSVKLADLDCDGWVDAFFTNGMTRDWFNSDLREQARASGLPHETFVNTPLLREPNLLFRNRTDLEFEDVTEAWGLGEPSVSFGAALGDLDNDGDLDMVVNNFGAAADVLRNDTPGTAHRVVVALRGTQSNRMGLGARVTLESDHGRQVRYLTPARGFMASDEPSLFFGVGPATRVQSLTIRWPSGIEQVLEDLPVDYRFVVEEKGQVTEQTVRRTAHPLFVAAESSLLDEHQETDFDDYTRQPLLPHELSQLGPGIAWSDVDSDGDLDLAVSGAAGSPTQLYLNVNGRLHRQTVEAWERDAACEDAALVFFDCDGDGDQDLYAASGSVEFPAGAAEYADRLYLNHQGQFSAAAAEALPNLRTNSSGVAVADYDRDGDLDLFVGSRSIPDRYPMPPESHLLNNVDGHFQDVTEELAEGLKSVGLVSGAIWTDLNNDSWPDLVVACDWGAVEVFLNRQGKLQRATREAGLDQYLGWWNSVTAGDVDGDGDFDLVAGNVGLNTKYHATREKPIQLFYGDVDGSGTPQLVEAEAEDDHYVPIRGKSCTTRAMPLLSSKFPTFESFATASLNEIYSESKLKNAHKFTANFLETSVLLNDGAGKFQVVSLPRIAQVSPTYGILVLDLDLDGHLDICLAQNFFGPQPETGRYDGGLGLLLRGNGRGEFQPVEPADSGIVVPEDAKGLASADINGDHKPDLVFGINDARPALYENQGERVGLAIALVGRPGNPTAVGARVRVVVEGLPPQMAEVHAGGGYWSQSSPVLMFASPGGQLPQQVEVTWPDGKRTTHTEFDQDDAGVIRIAYPGDGIAAR